MIEWAVIVDKVPSVAVVLLFVCFTLKMLGEFRDYLVKLHERWIKQSEDRDQVYLEKLGEVGNKQSDGIEVVSKDIRKQTVVMTKICEQMETHDDLLKFIADDVRARHIRGS